MKTVICGGLLSAFLVLFLLSAPVMADEPEQTHHYRHPAPEEIPEPRGPHFGAALPFDAGALVENTPGIASTFADLAIQEFFAPDSMESPAGSDCVKYNEWFYGRRVSNMYENGEYQEQYGWNAVFVSWCADKLGLIELGRFPRTCDGGELFHSLLEYGYDHIQSNSIHCDGNFEAVRTSDLIFVPDDDLGLRVGIVTEAGSGYIRYLSGDTDAQIRELTMLIEDCDAGVSFVRVKPIEDYGLYVLTEFLKSELGLNTAAVSGIAANIWYESSFDPNRIGDDGTSFGICQWHNERWGYLSQFCSDYGYDSRSAEGQLRFLKYELETEYGDLLSRLRESENSKEGAYYCAFYFCVDYEYPEDMETKANERGDFACNSVFDRIIENA